MANIILKNTDPVDVPQPPTDKTSIGINAASILFTKDATGVVKLYEGTGSVTSVDIDSATLNTSGGPITGAGTLVVDLPAQASAGTFTNANITVDGFGRVTSAASGSGGGSTGTVTSVSATGAQGVTTNVATPTTTPTITIGLGAITPTSVAATGTVTGSNISGSSSGTNTGDQTITLSGAVAGTGTGAITTTYSGVVPIAKGGTGQTTAPTAINALLPPQAGHAGLALTSDGINAAWAVPAVSVDELIDVDITSPLNGQMLTFKDGDWINGTDVKVTDGTNTATLIMAPPDATTNPELQIFGGLWTTDFDTSVPSSGVRLGGNYIALEATDISMQLNSAQVGSRVICVGLTERGNAILGVEPPPVPTYSVQTGSTTNTLIYDTGTIPSPWVPVTGTLTTTQDINANTAIIYFEVVVENIGNNKTGTVEIGVGLNGATPLAINSVAYAMGSFVKQLFANSATNVNFLPTGTTARLYARAITGSSSGFDIFARNAERPSLLKVAVLGSGGGSGTPGGPSTAIQFNNAGAFGGSANFTYLDSDPLFSSSQITFNNTSGNRIVGADGSSGRSLQIVAGTGTSGSGGTIAIVGGQGAGTGGTVTITGGRTDGAAQPGADVIIQGGGANNSGGNGGNIRLQAGTTLNATNGALKFQTGNPSTDRLWIDGNGAWQMAGTTPGTSGQVLTSTGATTPPSWQTAAGGATSWPSGTVAAPGWPNTTTPSTGMYSVASTTEIDFAISGARALSIVGGSTTINSLQFITGDATVVPTITNIGTGTSANGRSINILARDSVIGAAVAGSITISSGSATGTPPAGSGTLTIKTGSTVGTGQTVGLLSLQAGNATGATPGGAISIVGGGSSGSAQSGGEVLVQGGAATNTGGAGGNIRLQAGTATAGSGGALKIQTGASTGTDRLWIDGNGAWLLAGTAPGGAGQVLTSAGSGAPPTWTTVTSGGGIADAPVDGNGYVRQDAAWTSTISGGTY